MKITDSKGLTFIELVVIVGVIGIIAAIALPQFIGYAHKTSVRTTLRNMAAAQEDHFAMYGFYSACTSVQECKNALSGIRFKPAGNVDIAVVVKNEGRDFAIMAIHGDKITVECWDSGNGGLQKNCSTAGF